MDLSADLTLAARRAEAKQRVAALLAELNLSAGDRKAVLLDLAVEATAPAKPIAQQFARAVAGASRVAKRGRPPSRANGADEGTTLTAKLLTTLAAHPGMRVRELAAKVYGDDTAKMRGRARSLIASLHKKGRLQNRAPGEWEVVE